MNISRMLGSLTHDLLDRFNFSNTAPPKPQPPAASGEAASLAHLVSEVDFSDSYLQQDAQVEARELIAKHTRYLGADLDESGLGKELARGVNERPELARAVYTQLSIGNKVEVARVMVGAMSDDELRGMAWSEDGQGLLHDINRWVANNSLTGGRMRRQTQACENASAGR